MTHDILWRNTKADEEVNDIPERKQIQISCEGNEGFAAEKLQRQRMMSLGSVTDKIQSSGLPLLRSMHKKKLIESPESLVHSFLLRSWLRVRESCPIQTTAKALKWLLSSGEKQKGRATDTLRLEYHLVGRTRGEMR